MTTLDPGITGKKKRPGRKAMMALKRQQSQMAGPEELAAALGIGRNQAYELLKEGKVPAMRFGRRWLVPRAVIAKLVSGET